MDGISVEEFAEIRAREAYDMGEQAGAVQKEQEIGLKLKAMGMPAEQIAEATGLTVEEIEEL